MRVLALLRQLERLSRDEDLRRCPIAVTRVVPRTVGEVASGLHLMWVVIPGRATSMEVGEVVRDRGATVETWCGRGSMRGLGVRPVKLRVAVSERKAGSCDLVIRPARVTSRCWGVRRRRRYFAATHAVVTQVVDAAVDTSRARPHRHALDSVEVILEERTPPRAVASR